MFKTEDMLCSRRCNPSSSAFSLSLVGRVRGVQKVTKREQGTRARSKTSILLPIPSLIIGLIFLKRREFIGFLFKLGILTVNLFFVYLFIKIKRIHNFSILDYFLQSTFHNALISKCTYKSIPDRHCENE